MKKTLGLILYAFVMFGVTAGLGMMMMKKSSAPSTKESDESAKNSERANELGHGLEFDDPSDAGSRSQSVDDSEYQTAGRNASDLSDSLTDGTESRVDERLPVAIRATPMSVEEIVRMGLSLKSRDEVVKKREEALREMEAQQRLIQTDVVAAQQDIENLLAQIADQRAAKQELLTRIASQNSVISQEREELAAAREQLRKEREDVDTARRELDVEKATLAQNENDLTIRRSELDMDIKTFEETQTRTKADRESFAKERARWIPEKERLDTEKKQLQIDRDQLKTERALFEQDKSLFASTTGTNTQKTAPPDADTQLANNRNVASQFESMTPDVAAKNIKHLADLGEHDVIVGALLLVDLRKSGPILDALDAIDETLAPDLILRMSQKQGIKKNAKRP